MKHRFIALSALTLLFSASSAHAAGMIIESIKAHAEQHQTRPRLNGQRHEAPAPQNAIEQWVRAVLEAPGRSK